jgi:hypothetical protein
LGILCELIIPILLYYDHVHLFLSSFDLSTFITTINGGQGSVFRDQEVLHSNVQLPIEVYRNSVVGMYVDGEPCIAIAGKSSGASVYLLHALTLCEVRSISYKENVWCVCINADWTKLFFGTESG